jgi:hypothetical protein
MEDKSNHQNKFAPDTTHLFHVQDATITMLCFLTLCPGHCYYNICSALKWAVTTIHHLILTLFSPQPSLKHELLFPNTITLVCTNYAAHFK